MCPMYDPSTAGFLVPSFFLGLGLQAEPWLVLYHLMSSSGISFFSSHFLIRCGLLYDNPLPPLGIRV